MPVFRYASIQNTLTKYTSEQGSRADMRYTSLKDFLKSNHAKHAPSPMALIFVEDAVEIDTTARPVSYTHLRSPRDRQKSRMPSSA